MNPYQPIPIDIPVSQNLSPSHPYSQNFPDEPESKDSQIQVSSSNHNQQYPSQNFNSDQPSQIDSIDQAYNQVVQYAMAAGLEPVDAEMRNFEKKMRDIDARLDSGISYAYRIWLYLNILCSCLFGLTFCFTLVSILAFHGPERRDWPGFGMKLIWITWCIWAFHQSLVMKNAMNSKKLEGMRRGFRLMIWFAAYYFLSFIAFLLLDNLDLIMDTFSMYEVIERFEASVTGFVRALIFFYVPPMFCNLFGAIKVRSLLEKRETLIFEFSTQYGAVANLA